MSALCAVQATAPQVLEPTVWLEQYGDYLYRHALFRLGDRSAAEDVVQETLLGALKSQNRFAGMSNERTWLIGIMKHKISDYFRNRRDETSLNPDGDCEREFFDQQGAWRVGAQPVWPETPESLLETKDFQRVLELCLKELPQRLAQVFILREVDQLSTEEICELLDLTPSNLWVMLHRARLRLQQLIGLYWLNVKAADC